nr:bacteriohemerythrin [uncultured Cellulosilyticum sp.]
MIQWKESYRIGVDIIDEQHKKLFDLAEEAEEMLELPEHSDKFDEIVEIVNELRDYVKYHFAEEEKILFEIQYSKFFKHKVAHNDFVDYIYKLDMDEIDRHQNDKILELLRALNDWLVEHVLVEDRQWSEVYKTKM